MRILPGSPRWLVSSAWERRPLRIARCARRTKMDLQTTRKGVTERVETWTWQRLASCNFP
jgi:hypothetical protein